MVDGCLPSTKTKKLITKEKKGTNDDDDDNNNTCRQENVRGCK
jgi:hypothetical protein